MTLPRMFRFVPLVSQIFLSLPTLLLGEMPSQNTSQANGSHCGPVRRDAGCEVVCGYNQQLQGGGVQEYAWCCDQSDDCAFDNNQGPFCVASSAASTGVVTSVLSMPRETVTSIATYTKISTLTSAVTCATTLRSVSTLTSAVTVSPTGQTHQTSVGSAANTASPTSGANAQSETQQPSKWHRYGKATVGGVFGFIALVAIIAFGIWWWRKRREAKAAAAGRVLELQPQNFAKLERNDSSSEVPQNHYAPSLQPRPSVLRQGPNPYDASSSPAPPYPGSRSQTPVQAYGYPEGNGSYDAIPAPRRQPRRPRRPVGGMPARVDSGEEYY